MTVRNRRTHRYIGLTRSAAVAGVKRSRQAAFVEADVRSCPRSLHIRTQRVHGTIEAESNRGQGTVEIRVSQGRQETRRKDADKRQINCALR